MSIFGINIGIGLEHQSTDKATVAMKRQYRVLLGMIEAMKDIESNTKKVAKRQREVDKATDRINKSTTSLLSPVSLVTKAFGKMFTLMNDSYDKIIEFGVQFEERWTRLASVLGSKSLATKTNAWMRDIHSQFNILNDDLQDFVFQMNKFGIPPEMASLKGVLSAAHGPGMDFNNVMSSMISLAQSGSGDIRAFQEALNYKVDPQGLREVLAGTQTVQERIIAISGFLENEYPEGFKLANRTIGASLQRTKNVFQTFWETAAGGASMRRGNFMYELQEGFKQVADYLQSIQPQLKSIGRTISRTLGSAVRTLSYAVQPLVDRFKAFFSDSHKAIDTFKKGAAVVQVYIGLVGNLLRKAFEDPVKALGKLKDGFLGLFSGFKFVDIGISIGKGIIKGMAIVFKEAGKFMFDAFFEILIGKEYTNKFKKMIANAYSSITDVIGGGTLGAVLGGVIGFLLGGPVGAIAGMGIGAAMGGGGKKMQGQYSLKKEKNVFGAEYYSPKITGIDPITGEMKTKAVDVRQSDMNRAIRFATKDIAGQRAMTTEGFDVIAKAAQTEGGLQKLKEKYNVIVQKELSELSKLTGIDPTKVAGTKDTASRPSIKGDTVNNFYIQAPENGTGIDYNRLATAVVSAQKKQEEKMGIQ